jgi:hypothetical protein
MSLAPDDPFIAAIKRSPGPAPWYLSQPASDLSSPARRLTWERDSKAGPSLLKDDRSRIYAAVAMYTYVSRISLTQFLVWRVDAPEPETSLGMACIDLYDIDMLSPLTSLMDPLAMKADRICFIARTTPRASVRIPRNLPIGDTPFSFPPEFHTCDPFFVLVSDPGRDKARIHLWTVDPRAESIRVVSQTWFADGPYDFGYQWITRITREPASGVIVGDGIRIKGFVLNSDGTEFVRWLDNSTTLPPSSLERDESRSAVNPFRRLLNSVISKGSAT